MTSQQPTPMLAYNLQAIPQDFRPLHQASLQRVFASLQEVQELATGYALRLPNDPEVLQVAMTFISYERLCCPFFRFELAIEPDLGPIWLRLTGDTDVKPFLQGILPK
ncbi:MAG TPA: hypothetical protein VFU49_14220 [Ktedonobacteraceae bacterium]|nr:hypothetical protein [Ktedonobacteraceae bacterium]